MNKTWSKRFLSAMKEEISTEIFDWKLNFEWNLQKMALLLGVGLCVFVFIQSKSCNFLETLISPRWYSKDTVKLIKFDEIFIDFQEKNHFFSPSLNFFQTKFVRRIRKSVCNTRKMLEFSCFQDIFTRTITKSCFLQCAPSAIPMLYLIFAQGCCNRTSRIQRVGFLY